MARHGGRSLGIRVVLIGAMLAAAGLSSAGAASAADDGSVTFVGHGWGHGRGMGQYGAYGYAVDYGWSYDKIVGHFYGNTALTSDAGNPTLSVELTRMTGRDTIVTAGGALAVNGAATGAGAVLVHRTGTGTFSVSTAPGCGGPWTVWNGAVASGLSITAANGLPVVCEPTKATTYRGSITVVDGGGTQYTESVVPLQDYLKAVLPREVPASWGSSGGGKGMEALKAQAVAARSYALAYGTRSGSGASICDSTSCQVYGGQAEQPYGGTTTTLENALTNAAVDVTAGQVIRFSGGAIAKAEFSSSTGGWTAGGAFPAVEDLGDSTTANPNHTWSVTTTYASVASALGTGTIRSIAVTKRNGLGADGGRATEVTVVDTSGKATKFSGDAVRSQLGLKSDWFTVTGITAAEASAVVRALYQDVLDRGPDGPGLEHWTTIVQTTGNPRLVADGIVNSPERLQALVREMYRSALHRDPEPVGLASWVSQFQRGATVADIQIGVFASPESLQVLGGGDVRGWVAGMYVAILGRPAGDSEVSGWATVAAQQGREAAVAGIARSVEAGLLRLDGYYVKYLGRHLDGNGVASWLPEMSGRGDFTVPGFIGGSQEYWNRAQTRFP